MSVELSIEEALKLAISYHQANRLPEAESIYQAILQKQPKHQVANHNLGLLAIAVGKTDLALPFLKTALEANPNIAQFWLSYISALLKLNNIDGAKQVLEQAKGFGLAQDLINRLQQQIDMFGVENLFNTAIALREEGKYQAAIIWLQNWLASNQAACDELLATAHAHLTQMLLLNKKEDIAREHIDKALSLAPNLSVVLRNYARVLLKMQKFDDALQVAKRAVNVESENLENLLVFASALRAKKENQKALEIVEYILQKRPNYAEALANRGLLKFALKDNLGAIVDIEQALSIKPHLNELVSILSSLYYQNKQIDEAIGILEKELEKNPDNVDYMINIGEFKRQTYKIKESIEILQRAVSLAPDNANAWANLGTALQSDGKLEEAKEAYVKALSINPKLAEVANNLAALAMQAESYESALLYLEQAITHNPNNPTLLANKGAILLKLRRPPNEIGEIANQIIAMAPDTSDGYRLLGLLYEETGEFTKAVECFKAAIARNPSSAELYTAIAGVYRKLMNIEAAKENYLRALKINPDSIAALGGLLFTSNYRAETFNKEEYDLAVRFGKLCRQKAAHTYDSWLVNREPKRLRVGFVSGDFREHVVSYFLEGFIKEIDTERLELIAYPTYHKTDDTTKLLKSYFAEWTPIYGLSDKAAAERIHQDGIHILIDLSGHTAYNRLPVFSYKPAPVQVSWLGYFATTGIQEIDYILADKYVAPEEEASHFVEKIWRLPDSYLCFTPPAKACPVNVLPALQNGYITFGCFNNLSKIGDKVIALWAKIMLGLPQSKLMLKAKELADSSNITSIQKKFTLYGVEAERLILKGPSSRIEYLEAYNKVDIALDPFPYHGGTTSVEGLWMGVPVITKAGNTFLSHIGESIAHNSGQSEWIAKNDDEYIEKAIHFASDLEHLSTLRSRLREKLINSPIMDAKRFAKNFETAMYEMWQKLGQSLV